MKNNSLMLCSLSLSFSLSLFSILDPEKLSKDLLSPREKIPKDNVLKHTSTSLFFPLLLQVVPIKIYCCRFVFQVRPPSTTIIYNNLRNYTMETDSFAVGIIPVVDTTAVTVPIASRSTTTVPLAVILTIPSTVFVLTVPVLPAYAKPFLGISRIEVFFGQNFKCWHEHIHSTLDMHGVA